MNHEKYLQKLQSNLSVLPDYEVNEIVNEIDMHIHEALSNDRLEKDILLALGSPDLLTQDILKTYDLTTYIHANKKINGKQLLTFGLRSALILTILSTFAFVAI